MSIELFKDVAMRTMDAKGLTPSDMKTVRKKYKNKVSRKKIDLVLSSFSNPIITKGERERLLNAFGKSYNCVIDLIAGRHGLALAIIQMSLKTYGASKTSRKHEAALNILRTLTPLTQSFDTNKCTLSAMIYSASIFGSMVSLFREKIISSTDLSHIAAWMTKIYMNKKQVRQVMVGLNDKRWRVRLHSVRALRSLASSRMRVYPQALSRLTHILLKDSATMVRKEAANTLYADNARKAIPALMKSARGDPSRIVRLSSLLVLLRYRKSDANVRRFLKTSKKCCGGLVDPVNTGN